MPQRLHSFLKFPRAPWDRMEIAMSRHFYSDLTATVAFLQSSMACLWHSSWRFHSSCHAAHSACSQSSHCADRILFAFRGNWNNWQGPHIASPTWWCISVNISQTKLMYISTSINNTLLIPLTQINVIKAARVILNKNPWEAVCRTFYWTTVNDFPERVCFQKALQTYKIKYWQNYVTFTNEIHS